MKFTVQIQIQTSQPTEMHTQSETNNTPESPSAGTVGRVADYANIEFELDALEITSSTQAASQSILSPELPTSQSPDTATLPVTESLSLTRVDPTGKVQARATLLCFDRVCNNWSVVRTHLSLLIHRSLLGVNSDQPQMPDQNLPSDSLESASSTRGMEGKLLNKR